MIQKMSDEHKINFLDNSKSSEVDKKLEKISKKTLNQISEEQKSKKLINKDNGMMTSKHISSARTGAISDEGSSSKYIKSESSNTIWGPNKSFGIDSKTKTIQDKAQISLNKREAENKRMKDMADTLKSTIQEKDSSISPAGTQSGTNYKITNNNMSIFDNKDFQRLEEKTGGEKISEDIKNKKNQKDNSWRNGGKIVSSKDITRKLFDGLFGKQE